MKRERRDLCVCALLALLTALSYLPTLQCDFVNLDDNGYVTENAAVAGGLTPEGVAYAFTTSDMGYWIPLTWLSLELDASLAGLNPAMFHATNLFLHVANVLLLYFVLRRTTGGAGRSTAVAALFAVHPLHVESVAWVTERKDVLSTFWLLAALYAYERYAAKPSPGRMALVCLAAALGLASKPMLVTFPLLLLLMDYWPLQRVARGGIAGNASAAPPPTRWLRLILEKTPLFALSLAAGILTILAQKSFGAVQGLDRVPVLIRLGNAIHACGWYLGKTLVPADLCAFYPLQPDSFSWWQAGVSASVLVIVSAYVVAVRKNGYPVFGWLWYLITLAPVIGLIQVGGQSHADRFVYVPHIGLFTFLVWECWRWLEKLPAAKWLAPGLTGAAAASCAAATFLQIGFWKDSETLWARVLELDPENYAGHGGIGMLRQTQNRLDEAEASFERALRLQPSFAPVIFQLGRIHQQRGEWDQAREYFAWALRLQPGFRDAAKFLAELPPPARPTANRPAPPAEAVARNRAGLAHARRGDMHTALGRFEAALAVAPDYAEAHNNAGLALQELKRLDAAERSFRKAVSLAPENADFHVNLASLLESRGHRDDAVAQYQEALRLKPEDAETRLRLQHLTHR